MNAHQGILEEQIRRLFPAAKLTKNARKEASLTNPTSGRFLELDIFLPDLDLAFEFQDTYHFSTTWYFNLSINEIYQRDIAKSAQLRKSGVSVVSIPYWWDTNMSSLMCEICFQRPDLLKTPSPLIYIPINPPLQENVVPDVGEVMVASTPLYSSFADSLSTENTWWLGEKYDGVHCVWNPNTRVLYNRRGKVIALPAPFFHHLKVKEMDFLEGELWLGRGGYAALQSSIIYDDEESAWHFLRLIGFDDPSPKSQAHVFEWRYASLLTSFSTTHPYVIPALRILYNYTYDLSTFLKCITTDEGEGIMLRELGSYYENGVSGSLVKLKAVRGDSEALVVDASTESVEIQLPSGETTKIPISNSRCVPVKGEIVTLEYDSYTQAEIPKNPTILRVRSDLTWREVVGSYQQKPHTKSLNEVTRGALGKKETREVPEYTRPTLEDFAKTMKLDPLLPSTWYYLASKYFAAEKTDTAKFPLPGGPVRALMQMFPEIGLEELKFSVLPAGYWDQIENRKKIFDNFAKEHNFDPLIAENWYSVSNYLHKYARANQVKEHYGRSLTSTLSHLYPTIVIPKNSHLHWSEAKNRKEFFVSFAQQNKFDPLVAQNWYPIQRRDILIVEGGSYVLQYYSDDVAKALMTLFPTIGLEREAFHNRKHNQFTMVSANSDRLFFDNVARKLGKDPNNVTHWYFISSRQVRSFQGGRSIISHYKNYYTALSTVYPDLKFNPKYFRQM